MNKNIEIKIRQKKAVAIGDPHIVCDNSDYTITFDFDEEWENLLVKTAVFKYKVGDETRSQKQPFSGNIVEMPPINNTRIVEVGVFAGDLKTTTPAWIPCSLSILSGDSVPEPPSEEVYNELIELINRKSGINFAQFDIDTSDGNLYLTTHYEHEDFHFELNEESGDLEVVFDET